MAKKKIPQTNHCNTTNGQQPSCQKSNSITQPVLLKAEELPNHQSTQAKSFFFPEHPKETA